MSVNLFLFLRLNVQVMTNVQLLRIRSMCFVSNLEYSQNYDLEFKTGSTESSCISSFCCLHLSLSVYVVFAVYLCARLPLNIHVFSNITPCQLVNVCSRFVGITFQRNVCNFSVVDAS